MSNNSNNSKKKIAVKDESSYYMFHILFSFNLILILLNKICHKIIH